MEQLADLYEDSYHEGLEDLAFFVIGPEERALVHRMSIALPQRVFSLDDVLDALCFLDGGANRRLLVPVLSHRLTSKAIKELLASFPTAGDRIGFISGRTEQAVTFSMRKMLARWRKNIPQLDVFDAIEYELDHARADVKTLRSRLISPTAVKILRCHGEGSHAKLSGLTVCGLLDPLEFPDHPDLGCARYGNRCKRAPSLPGDRVLFGRDIRAQVVFFLCCNGFNFAGELYPSPVSIALSLAEGCVAAVIAPIRAVTVPTSLLSWLTDRIKEGGQLGDIVHDLNRRCSLLGQDCPYILHGDPAALIDSYRSKPPPHSTAIPIVQTTDRDMPDRIKIEASRAWLVELRMNAERALRILNALEFAAPRVDVVQIKKSLLGIRQMGLSALKRSELAFRASDVVSLTRDLSLLRLLLHRADALFARAIVEARRYVDPFDLLHYDQVLSHCVTGPDCDRCGTPTSYMMFGAREPEMETRRGIMCDVCGPKSEHRLYGLVLAGKGRFERSDPGGPINFVVNISLEAAGAPLLAFAAVSFRVFDKARDHCFGSFNEPMEVGSVPKPHSMALPADLSADLHSVRVVAVCGLDLAYFRCRVASGPDLTSAAISSENI